MSAVVEAVVDFVGGVVEAVGDVVEGVVDVVKDVGRAIDDYIIQPILDDPLTAIATVAAATFLGPAAASLFGTSAAVGTGIAAGLGNTAAGLVQGEDFGEAIKGGLTAGVMAYGGAELSNAFSSDVPASGGGGDISGSPEAIISEGGGAGPNIVTPDVAPAASGLDAMADVYTPPSAIEPVAPAPAPAALTPPLPSVEVTSPLMALNQAAPQPTIPEFSAAGLDSGFTADYSLGTGMKTGFGSNIPSFTPDNVLDIYGAADYGLVPPGSPGGPGLQPSGAPNLTRMGGGQGLIADVEGLPEFRYSDNTLDPALRGQTDSWVGESGKTYGLETPDVTVSSTGIRPTPEAITYDATTNVGTPSTWDRVMSGDYTGAAKDIGQGAFNWVKENPMTAGLGALTLLGGGLGGPRGGPPNQGPPKKGTTRDASFSKPLDLYNYMRDRNNYAGDLRKYGQAGQTAPGEHQFFENTRFEPVQPAKMGGLIQMKRFAQGGFAQGAPAQQDPRMQDPRMRDPRQMQMMQAMSRQQPQGQMPGRPAPQGMPPQGGPMQAPGPQGLPQQAMARPVAQRPKDPRMAYYQYGNPPVQEKARGGLSSVHSMRIGGGADGRSDDVPAVLSDGEYVMDAESVAMLGNGSSKAGAAKLDQMRSKLRQHKGKALAGGKISPDAKSPLSYLKGA